MVANTTRCAICGNMSDNRTFSVREMMFGFRNLFEYFECARCRCLQIKEIPSDLQKYYPVDYYSYRKRSGKAYNPVNRFISAQRTYYWIGGRNLIGKLATLGRKKGPPYFIDWIRGLDLKAGSRILDVGSGTGELLIDMSQYGFRDLTGIDPYISEEVTYNSGVRILKKDIHSLSGEFDLIILNGSFEHMPNPIGILNKVYDLLAPGAYAFIRIPLSATYAWRNYGVDWVQIDAPRHLFLHTIESMRILSEKSKLTISSVIFDSYDMQFWGSEQYKHDIPLMDARSLLVNPDISIFSKGQIDEFKRKSVELNAINDGDQARFCLRKL